MRSPFTHTTHTYTCAHARKECMAGICARCELAGHAKCKRGWLLGKLGLTQAVVTQNHNLVDPGAQKAGWMGHPSCAEHAPMKPSPPVTKMLVPDSAMFFLRLFCGNAGHNLGQPSWTTNRCGLCSQVCPCKKIVTARAAGAFLFPTLIALPPLADSRPRLVSPTCSLSLCSLPGAAAAPRGQQTRGRLPA